jgi:hypothetical protein
VYDPRFVLRSFDTLNPDQKVAILYSMLDALVLADTLYLQSNPGAPGVYQANLVYQPEEIGHDDWRDVPSILDHGGGDCEDLACFRVAELRVRTGENCKPYVSWQLVQSQKYGTFTLYHIRVQRADGSIEDPSKILGMP